MAYERHDPMDHPGYHGSDGGGSPVYHGSDDDDDDGPKYNSSGDDLYKGDSSMDIYKKEDEEEKKEDEEELSEFEQQLEEDEKPKYDNNDLDEENIAKAAATQINQEMLLKPEDKAEKKRTKKSIEDAIEKAIQDEKDVVHLNQ